MCFSETIEGKPPAVEFPYHYKIFDVSDEFKSKCDYVDLESRKELTSDTKSLTLIQLNI